MNFERQNKARCSFFEVHVPSGMIDPFSTQQKVLKSSKEGSIDKPFKTLQRPSFYYVKGLKKILNGNWRTPYIYEEDLRRNLTSTHKSGRV
jgi:hypothetical protein